MPSAAEPPAPSPVRAQQGFEAALSSLALLCPYFVHGRWNNLGRKAVKPFLQLLKRALPGPVDHLGDKADLTPSPLQGQAATGAV